MTSEFKKNIGQQPEIIDRYAVDLVSNSVVITAYNQKNIWHDVWNKSIIPEDLLLVIMHEITHHSCLQSVVGASFSALAVSYWPYAHIPHLQMLDAAQSDRATRIRQLQKFWGVRAILMPLLEGLALATEFDTEPDDLPLATWAQMTAQLMCVRQKLTENILEGRSADIDTTMRDMLRVLRLQPETISKKSELFERSIADPYLLGYLAVKNLMHYISQSSPWRTSQDLLVMFLVDYYFNDYQLAAIVSLDRDNISIEEELEEISAYMACRTVELLKNIGHYSVEFLNYYSNLTKSVPGYQNYTTQTEMKIANARHWQSVGLSFVNLPDIKRSRTIPRLLVSHARIEKSESRQFSAYLPDGNQFPFTIQEDLDESKLPLVLDGSVEVVILLPRIGMDEIRVVIFILSGNNLLAAYEPFEIRQNHRETLDDLKDLSSFISHEDFANCVHRYDLGGKNTKEGSLLIHIKESGGQQLALKAWAPHLALMSDEDLDAHDTALTAQRLLSTNLSDILGLRTTEIINLSKLSIECACRGRKLDEHEESLCERVNVMSRKELGFRLMHVENSMLLFSRI